MDALLPVKTVLGRRQPLRLERIVSSGGWVQDGCRQPAVLADTGNRVYKSRSLLLPDHF